MEQFEKQLEEERKSAEKIAENCQKSLNRRLDSCYIRYKFIATDASGEETGSGSAALYVGGIL